MVSLRRSIGDIGLGSLNDTPIGHRQICKGGSIGHGVIRRMKTALACAQGAEAGEAVGPPEARARALVRPLGDPGPRELQREEGGVARA